MERHAQTEELRRALSDERLARALHLALRDVRLRARFSDLRAQGFSVEAAVRELQGPHADVRGAPYYLSEERVRGIVYRKGRARGERPKGA
jgi:hypothetical protein